MKFSYIPKNTFINYRKNERLDNINNRMKVNE